MASVRDETDFNFMKETMGNHEFWLGLQLVQSPNGDVGMFVVYIYIIYIYNST